MEGLLGCFGHVCRLGTRDRLTVNCDPIIATAVVNIHHMNLDTDDEEGRNLVELERTRECFHEAPPSEVCGWSRK